MQTNFVTSSGRLLGGTSGFGLIGETPRHEEEESMGRSKVSAASIAETTFFAVMVATLNGCGANLSGSEEGDGIGTSRDALLGVDTFLYFRSNATGFSPNDATRLRETADPIVFDLTYDVTQTWMVTNGDNGSFVETNQLNGWGTVQSYFGSTVNPVIVPGGGGLSLNPAGFTIQYPRLGKFRIAFNTAQNTFSIREAARAWEPVQAETPTLTTIAYWAQSNAMALAGHTNGDIFLTFNAGSSTPIWSKIDTNVLPNNAITSLAINPLNNQEIYAVFAGSVMGGHVWKTQNGGEIWQELAAAPAGVETWAISVNSVDPRKLYLIAEGTVFVSDDAGQSFTTSLTPDPFQPPLVNGDRISTVSVLDNNLDAVWVGTVNGQIWGTLNARAATPSWSRFNDIRQPGAEPHPTRLITRITPLPTNLNPPGVWVSFAGLLNDSVWLTMNGGQTWLNRHNADLPTTSVPVSTLGIYGVSVNPIDTSTVYANELGTNRSVNTGISWTHRSN
jgi:photosystem II stability/assembly factor-like uncharacterized protein